MVKYYFRMPVSRQIGIHTRIYLFFSGKAQCFAGRRGEKSFSHSLEIRIKSVEIAHTLLPNVFISEYLP